jgi:hypothetical protein
MPLPMSVGLQIAPLMRCRNFISADRCKHDLGQIDRRRLQLQIAGFNATDIE